MNIEFFVPPAAGKTTFSQSLMDRLRAHGSRGGTHAQLPTGRTLAERRPAPKACSACDPRQFTERALREAGEAVAEQVGAERERTTR